MKSIAVGDYVALKSNPDYVVRVMSEFNFKDKTYCVCVPQHCSQCDDIVPYVETFKKDDLTHLTETVTVVGVEFSGDSFEVTFVEDNQEKVAVFTLDTYLPHLDSCEADLFAGIKRLL